MKPLALRRLFQESRGCSCDPIVAYIGEGKAEQGNVSFSVIVRYTAGLKWCLSIEREDNENGWRITTPAVFLCWGGGPRPWLLSQISARRASPTAAPAGV